MSSPYRPFNCHCSHCKNASFCNSNLFRPDSQIEILPKGQRKVTLRVRDCVHNHHSFGHCDLDLGCRWTPNMSLLRCKTGYDATVGNQDKQKENP